jgi:hypothetical protein
MSGEGALPNVPPGDHAEQVLRGGEAVTEIHAIAKRAGPEMRRLLESYAQLLPETGLATALGVVVVADLACAVAAQAAMCADHDGVAIDTFDIVISVVTGAIDDCRERSIAELRETRALESAEAFFGGLVPRPGQSTVDAAEASDGFYFAQGLKPIPLGAGACAAAEAAASNPDVND